MKFVARLKAGERMTDLCEEFGISRKTGYKFLQRFEQYSAVGLVDMSRAPNRIPHRTPDEIVDRLVELRNKHPTWGPRKLRAYLLARDPGVRLPAASTVADWLVRKGLVTRKRRRPRPIVEHSPVCHAEAPNDVWCTDYKGQFRLGNGQYCYPLTLTDAYSRFLLACEGLANCSGELARPIFERCFRDYGLPSAMRSDNGAPFASRGLAGLTRLAVWWMRLGIRLERIEPASPEQNGRHERMHRVLKQETTRPAGKSLLQQQERFDRFQEIYNNERPHEALGQRPPVEYYERSPRAYPEKLTDPEYPLHDLVVRVRPSGELHIPGSGRAGGKFFLANSLAGELVGAREVIDGKWLVTFIHQDLVHLNLRSRRVEPIEPGKLESTG
jgi:putative transposase